MTREEIIEFCEMKAELESENEDIYEAIIKLLEQQPILDNGRMTIAQIYENAKRRLDKNEITIGEFCNVVDITVDAYKPPIGHWIKYQEPWGGMQGWKCSNCKNHYDVSSVYTIIPYNYCPNCGARMTESEGEE